MGVGGIYCNSDWASGGSKKICFIRLLKAHLCKEVGVSSRALRERDQLVGEEGGAVVHVLRQAVVNQRPQPPALRLRRLFSRHAAVAAGKAISPLAGRRVPRPQSVFLVVQSHVWALIGSHLPRCGVCRSRLRR